MKSNIARFFIEEIEGWRQEIENIHDESEMLEKKLEAVVRQNGITGIAATTEAHQTLLDVQTQGIDSLLEEFDRQELALIAFGEQTEDEYLPQHLRNRQDLLRKKMRNAEKEYLDIKFSCHDFVSQMLR